MKLAAVEARLDRLSGAARLGLVGGGYVAALAVAVLALFAFVAVTSGPDRDASSGMHAFADALFFVFVLAGGSVVPTGLLLHFMRAFATPWRVMASVGVAVSISGLLAVANIAQSHTEIGVGSMLAVPRVLLAPLLLGLFALAGIFAPHRGSRRWLFAAAGVECATSLYGAIHWLVPSLFR